MSYTYEARWFMSGAIPTDFESWFKQNCLANSSQQPEERVDIYLHAPGNEIAGIKLRQGRLEIKWRISDFGIVQFSNSVAGKIEKWRKWVCCDSEGEAFLPSQVENFAWVSVRKIRYSQLYQISPRLVPQPFSIQNTNLDSIKNSCNVELTLLHIREKTWWSVAFEAGGEEANLMQNLHTTASYLFSNYQGLQLLANNSFAYPSWLAKP